MTLFRRPRIFVLIAAIATALYASSSFAQSPGKADSPPNIIFIFVDDLGWGDLGTLTQNARQATPRFPAHQTPHLDQLAADGATLSQHYVAAPVCAPSRASLLLGVTQGHANVRDNQFDKALEDNHTLATVLKQAGYATAAVGKWGLQGVGKDGSNADAHPIDRGFDYYYGYIHHVDGHEQYPVEMLYFGNKINRFGPVYVWENRENVTEGLDRCYSADLFTARSKKWIVDHHSRNPQQPFFLYLAYATPHAVLELPAEAYPEGGGIDGGLQWIGEPGYAINTADGVPDSYFHPDYAAATYDHDADPETPGRAWPDVYRRYATSVRRIDDAIGDLRKLLEDLKIDRNTMIVFASDNGPSKESYLEEPYKPTFFGSYGPFDGIKRDLWEGGIRTPTFACWPDAIAPNTSIEEPSALWDWLPTFADIAGLPAPARADGISLLPQLAQSENGQSRDTLYFEYFNGGRTPEYEDFEPDRQGRKRSQMQAIRLGPFMGVRYGIQSHEDDFEIYNVVADPGQTLNLAENDHSGAFESLQKRLKQIAIQSRRPDPEAPRPYDDEAMAAVSPEEDLRPGLVERRFEESFPWVPSFTGSEATATRVAKSVALEGKRTKSPIGVQWTGFVEAPEDGLYTFVAKADTGIVIRLHKATVIDADFGYTPMSEKTATVRLSKGLHPITLSYRSNGQQSRALSLEWSGPGFNRQAIPASALFH